MTYLWNGVLCICKKNKGNLKYDYRIISKILLIVFVKQSDYYTIFSYRWGISNTSFNIDTSFSIDGETMERVTDFTFLGSKIIADGDCSH